jgi:hypothetical protein
MGLFLRIMEPGVHRQRPIVLTAPEDVGMVSRVFRSLVWGSAMSSGGSVTKCFHLMEQGDSQATHMFCERFLPNLVNLARRQMYTDGRTVADGEDVAYSDMDSFHEEIGRGGMEVA